MLKSSYILLFLLLSLPLAAQVVEVSPTNLTAGDSLTITFHADRGNKVLMDFEGEVYIHTGVIIGTVDEPSGWRYVQGNWGQDDKRMRCRKLAENTYQYSLLPRSFYGFGEDEPLLQLAMVFRNADGTRVAKNDNEKDIFYPELKTYPNGILEMVGGKDGTPAGNLLQIIDNQAEIILKGSQHSLYLTHFTDDIIALALRKYRKQPQEFEVAVLPKPTKWDKKIENKLSAPSAFIRWGENYKIEIQKSPLKLLFYRADTLLFAEEIGLFEDKNEHFVGYRTRLLPNEHIYGTGSRAINIDRRGHRLYAYNTASFGYTLGETRLNMSIPYLQSSRLYGLFFDNPRRAYFDIGKTEKEVLEYGVLDTAAVCYVIMGKSHPQILESYTYLTGRQSLPPVWALGFMQSRFGYKSQQETEEITYKTLDAGFPLEATLLDLYWFGDLPQMGNLSFDSGRFPRPGEMVSNLNKRGVKTLLITESYFVQTSHNYAEADSLRLFARLSSGKTAKIPDFWAGPAALLDVYKPEAQTWFWQKYARLWKTYNIHGWWCDSGEPENHPKRMVHKIGTAEEAHNLYPLFWAKLIHENHYKQFPSRRLFNLSRSGYAGVQRYDIFPWSGDVSRSWEAMRAQTGIMLGAGSCGIGYMHSDLGGFTGGPLDEDLYKRWLQMGAFVPVMRAHGSGLPSEPVFFSEETQRNVKQAIKLRYRLLPYNYTLAFENHTRGLPLARPLYFYHPQDEFAMQVDDAYMWGENLLIAPIFEKGATSRKVYLPQGKWFDFHTFSEWWGGGKPLTLPVFEDRIPVFVKAGAFIPIAPEMKHTSSYKTDTLSLNYFPDLSVRASSYTLYHDDGETPNAYEKGMFNLIQLKGSSGPNELKISLESENSYPLMPSRRWLAWSISNVASLPTSVVINKKNKLVVVADAMGADMQKAYYDSQNQRLIFYMDWDNLPAEIRVLGAGLLDGK